MNLNSSCSFSMLKLWNQLCVLLLKVSELQKRGVWTAPSAGEPGCFSHGFCPSRGALRVDGSVCVGAQSQLISLLLQDPVHSVQDLPLYRRQPAEALHSTQISTLLPPSLLFLPPSPSDQKKPSRVVWGQLLKRIIAGATKKIHFTEGHW